MSVPTYKPRRSLTDDHKPSAPGYYVRYDSKEDADNPDLPRHRYLGTYVSRLGNKPDGALYYWLGSQRCFIKDDDGYWV